MAYPAVLFPFRVRRLNSANLLAVSDAGDYVFLRQEELNQLFERPETLPREKLAELKSKFFLGDPYAVGTRRLLASRVAARQETVSCGPSLYLLVVTLLCGHSCRYCQVSRALGENGYTMSEADLDVACDAIFQSPSPILAVEFQGGDPLIRFDLVRHAIERIETTNQKEKRDLRFIVASTLHQLDESMCAFFKAHNVYLSTSIDGPAWLHNRNRPLRTRDAYERTVAGIRLARERMGPGAVSALMTTTRESLNSPEAIVDEYVSLGFDEVFIRPLSRYGFAKRNRTLLGYSLEEFQTFYERAFERVVHWNRHGVALREVSAAIALNKMLSPFDAGYIDLQSPTGAGLATLVYNYDGYVYPSDESRMLAETGDTSVRLGRIGEPLERLLGSPVQRALVRWSDSRTLPGCRDCSYNVYCGPDPVSAYNEHGTFEVPAPLTEHCQRQMGLFDFLFKRLREGDDWFEELAYTWAQPPGMQHAECHA